MDVNFVDIIKNNDYQALADLPLDSIPHNSNFNFFENKSNSIFLNHVPDQNMTLLHIASLSSSTECFLYLNTIAGFELDIKDANGNTPLHHACFSGSCEIVGFILNNIDKESLDEIYLNDYNQISLSLYELALNSKSIWILKLLDSHGYSLSEFSPQTKFRINRILQRAILIDDPQILDWTMQKVGSSEFPIQTPLMIAIEQEKEDLIDLFIGKYPQQVDFINYLNQSALSIACYHSLVTAVRSICDVCQNIDLPLDRKGKCAVHWICESKSPEIASIILKKGIDTNRLDDKGNIGPFYLVDYASQDECLCILKLLCDNGYKIDNHGPDKKTILAEFVTSIQKYYQVIDFLITKGADTNFKIFNNTKTIKEYIINIAERDQKMGLISKKFFAV